MQQIYPYVVLSHNNLNDDVPIHSKQKVKLANIN